MTARRPRPSAPPGVLAIGFFWWAGGLAAAQETSPISILSPLLDADPPTISVDDTSSSEATGKLYFTVRLSTTSSEAVTVKYQTLALSGDSAATPGVDFEHASDTLTIAAGHRDTYIEVDILDDPYNEVDESLRLRIFEPSKATVDRATATGTILNDDSLPQVTVSDSTAPEGGGELAFEVTLSEASGRGVRVTYSIATLAGQNATEHVDYVPTSGTLSFTARQKTKTVRVTLLDDDLDEHDEIFSMYLSSFANARSGDPRRAIGRIQDNDGLPVLSLADAVGTEGTGDLAFGVTLNPVSGRDVITSYATTDGSALAGRDYDTASGTLTIPAGSTTGTILVPIEDDLLDEPAETFDLSLSEVVSATLGEGRATGTITDNDPRSTLSITDATAPEHVGDLTFLVGLSGPSDREVRVDYGTSNGTAQAGADYRSASGTLTFARGEISGSITVEVIDDTVDESAFEDFAVSLSNPANADLGKASASGTIQDNDGEATLAVSDVTASEADRELAFVVTLGGSTSATVTADYETVAETATEGVDYAPVSGSVRFASGQSRRTVLVAVEDDALDEINETVLLQLSNPTNATATAAGRGTILDDDPASTLSVADATAWEDDGPAVFEVSMDRPSGLPVTLTHYTRSGSAVSGSDFVQSTGSLSFSPGDTRRTIQVAVLDDTREEPDETFRMVLENARGGAPVRPEAVGTILDDESRALSVSGESGPERGRRRFVVTLSDPTVLPVRVQYDTANHTAVAGSDYRATGGVLTFAPGNTSRSITVEVLEDTTNEYQESFRVVLSNPVGARVGVGSAEGIIRDDDPLPTLAINGTEGQEGGRLDFTVTLSPASGRTVTTNYQTDVDLGTASAGSDYDHSTGSLTFAPGETEQTITVIPLDDDLVENAESLVVTMDSPVNARYILRTPTAGCLYDGCSDELCCACGIIVDNDEARLSVLDAAEWENNSRLAVVLTLSRALDQPVSVGYTTSDGTAVDGLDYERRSKLTMFQAGEIRRTVHVPLLDDRLVEGDETFTITLSNPLGAPLGDATATATIMDDDAPFLSIRDAAAGEGDGRMVFDVRMDRQVTTAITVDYATAASLDPNRALPGTDYESVSGILTFAAGESIASITVPIVDDTHEELDEIFLATLSAPGGGARLAVADAIGTIHDDDVVARLSIADATGSESVGELVFAVSLSEASLRDVALRYDTEDGSASTDDYQRTTGALTITAGETATTINVPVVDDDEHEPDESFTVRLLDVDGAIADDLDATGTILDDDEPPTASVVDAAGAEGDSHLAFRVSLNRANTRETTVAYATADGSARSGTDYQAISGKLTFAPGETSTAVRVPIIDDDLDEPIETMALTLSNPAHATLLDPEATGTIIDNDAPPALSVADTAGPESLEELAFLVSLDHRGARQIVVDYATSDGTAKAPSDYRGTTGRLTFASGDTVSTIFVGVVDDALDEPAFENFTVVLSNPANATLSDPDATGTIQDDDGEATLAVSDATASEADGVLAFTVTLGGTTSLPVSVDYATVEDTATETVDYADASGTLTFSPGQKTKTVEVAIVDDLLDEPSEHLMLTLSNARNASASGPARGTIHDDDSPPALSVAGAEGPEDGGDLAFVASLSTPAATVVTVGYATADATALSGSDYARATGTLTYASGETVATIHVALLDDELLERDETFAVTLSSPVGATLAIGSAVGTVLDDDLPPTLSVTDVTGPEGAGELAFPVTLDRPAGVTVTASYVTADGSALQVDDYGAAHGTLTIAPGETAATIRVRVVDDLLDESDETFTLALSAPAGATLAGDRATGTIVDDDAPPALSVADATGAENSGKLEFPVTLDLPGAREVVVAYATTEGTARADADYLAVSGTLTIAAGGTSATVRVTIVDDVLDEPDETFGLALASPSGATIAVADAIGTIIDDDVPPALSVADAAGPESIGELSFQVTLDVPSARRIAVAYASSDVTAIADEDYRGVVGTLVFEPGDRTQAVTVPVLDDLLDEPDETFAVTLSAAANATLADPDAIGTILDDAPPALSVADATGAENSGKLEFPVTLDLPGAREVVVAYATTEGTARADADYLAVSGTLTIAAGGTAATVRVTIVDDVLDEPDETFGLALASPSGATIADADAIGTIIDDDVPPALSVADAAGPESIGELSFQVTLDAPSARRIAVAYASSDVTAIADEDYRGVAGTLVFEPGDRTQAVTVPVLDDLLDEPDETFAVTLSAAANATLADPDAIGTILDDAPPALSVADAAGAESAGPLAFRVTLDRASALAVEVSYATSDGTAVAPGDYGAAAGTVTFAAGETARTARVAVADDALDEPDETFAVTLSAAANATLADPDATGTILDDDEPPMTMAELPDVLLCVDGATRELDLTMYFAGEELRFTAAAAAPQVAWANVDDTTLRLSPGAEGNTTVTVTATNATGTVSDQVGVRVVTDPAELAAAEQALSLTGGHLLAEIVSAVGERFDGPEPSSFLTADADVPDTGPDSLSPGWAGGPRASRVAWPSSRSSAFPGGGFGPAAWSGGVFPTPQTRRGVPAAALAWSYSDEGRIWSAWGRGGTRRHTRGSDDAFEGSLTAYHVGVETRKAAWRMGTTVTVATAQTEFAYERTASCGSGEGEGLLELDTLSLQPYAGRHLAGGGRLWAVGGLGRGKAALTRCGAIRRTTDASFALAAAGGRHPLVVAERWQLSLVEDGGIIRLETGEAEGPLGGLAARAGRARVGVALHWRTGPWLRSHLRTLVRGDWGAGRATSAFDIEAGTRYRNPANRFGINMGAWAAAGPEGRSDGHHLSLAILPRHDGSGLELSMTVGTPPTGLLPSRNDPGRRTSPTTLRLAYGLAARPLVGVLAPFAEHGATDHTVAGLRYRSTTQLPVRMEVEVAHDTRLGRQIRIHADARF